MSSQHKKSSFKDKVQEFLDQFQSERQAIRKELADSLTDVDHDFDYFRTGNQYEERELKDIAERMKIRATLFETKHPKLAVLFREFSELIRNMGI